MSDRRYYSKAPITEALIDFRLVPPEEASLTNLNDLFSQISTNYPNQDEYSIWEQKIPSEVAPIQSQLGYIYSTNDRKQVLSAARGGFTFSHLAPYDRWEVFRDEAKRLWGIYSGEVGLSSISRMATRYINRIDIPLPVSDLKQFLRTVPEVSPDLPQGLRGYFMQLQIPQEDVHAMIVINQAIIPPPTPEVVSILLDIEIFKEDKVFIDTDFWEDLEVLHAKLGSTFESCITDAVRELIK
jgi:uncharacterized protein (TIGR04255 family)